MSFPNHKGRPAKVGGSLPRNNLNQLFSILKGGSTSGNFGHSGRPKQKGGSAPAKSLVRPMRMSEPVRVEEPKRIEKNKLYGPHKGEHVEEALSWLSGAILSSKLTGQSKNLSEEAKTFLKETVESESVLYRGIGIVKSRVNPSNIDKLNSLQPGDEVPDFLKRQVSDIGSYTKKKNVANYYTEGSMSVLTEAKDKSKVLVDLENLPKVLEKYSIPHEFDDNDFDYFKKDKEVFVIEPIKAKVVSVKGKV